MGRSRLRTLCEDFHKQCQRASKADEVEALHWRVQKLVKSNRGNGSTGSTRANNKQPARLHMPTTRNAET
eukprot:9507596-Karenia_brevis.AAC.1